MIVADDGISANYNGLLTSIEHRFAHNYTLLANYTWSKCLGIAPVTSLGTGVIQNPNNVRGDYGPCTYDAPFLFNTSIVYASQFGHGGLLSHLLSNWNVAPLVRYQSGLPVNPSTGKDNSLTGSGLDRPECDSRRSDVHRRGPWFEIPVRESRSLHRQRIGTFGNAGHNSLRGPGYFDVDLAVSRRIQVCTSGSRFRYAWRHSTF